MISRDRLQALFLEMIQVYSPSKGEKEMADWIEAYLTKRGISFVSDNCGKAYGGNGRNIVAHIPGDLPGIPLGFMAHLDQIEPCKNVNAIVEGDIIRTDGTTTLGGDDGIAVAYALALLASKDIPHPPLEVIITVDEEIGCQIRGLNAPE